MTAPVSVADEARDLVARFHALPAGERNYRRAIWAGQLCDCLDRLARATPMALAMAHSNGQDVMAYELGTMVLDMRGNAMSDSDILDAVEAVISARMALGLPLPEGFTP